MCMSPENLVLRVEQIAHEEFRFYVADEDPESPFPDWETIARVQKNTHEELEFWMNELDGQTFSAPKAGLADAIAHAEKRLPDAQIAA